MSILLGMLAGEKREIGLLSLFLCTWYLLLPIW